MSRMLLTVMVVASALSTCNKKPASAPAATEPAASPPVPVPRAMPAVSELARQLAIARVDAANIQIANHAQDRALVLLVSALDADPMSHDAEVLMRKLLEETLWNFPSLLIKHPMPVEHLAFVMPSSLWVSLAESQAEGFNTTVRWDTESMKMESVLFPVRSVHTRSLVVGRNTRSIVIQRGEGPRAVTLLCDAKTLRPICDLGPLPENLTFQAVVASSTNGLLIAHPGPLSAADPQLIWRIRDAASGGVIRSSEPGMGGHARPLAAHLDSRRLRILHADGALVDLPVSPVEPVRSHPAAIPLALLHAQFSADGGSFMALMDRGADLAPWRRIYQISDPPDAAAPPHVAIADSRDQRASVAAWLADFPWSREPSAWSGLLRDYANPQDPPPVRIQENALMFSDSARAPLRSDAPITAAAFAPGRTLIGTGAGGVFIHRFLPLPHHQPPAPCPLNPSALRQLAEILSGTRFDESSRGFIQLSTRQRLDILAKFPPQQASTLLSGLDFSATLADIKASNSGEIPTGSLLPLWDRLARSDASTQSWKGLLGRAQALGDSRWHQDLTEAVALLADPSAAKRALGSDDPSPWLAQIRIRESFRNNDSAVILEAIQANRGKGPAAATALRMAMESASTEWIQACLDAATPLPPLLRLLANSRIAWLQKRMADAISLWPDEFPSYEKIRLTEDWDGWEQADFLPCYTAHLQAIKAELAIYETSPAATELERAAVANRLLDPATRGVIGRRRLMDYCFKAATSLAEFPENSAVCNQLANRARTLGAQPEPCLRIEALALTRLHDYKNAHACWVALITDHPVANHHSGDYAEAAYTAFENSEPKQAMDILTAGVRRFPEDANFALRAGWIALLTTNYKNSYQYLLAGLRVGFPDDKRENACVLLALAAALAGFPEDAATHYQNLLEIAPAWAEDKTIKALEWPQELKDTLLELAR